MLAVLDHVPPPTTPRRTSLALAAWTSWSGRLPIVRTESADHDEVGQRPSAMRPPSQPRLSYPGGLAAVTSSSEVNRPRCWLWQPLVHLRDRGSPRTCRSPRVDQSPGRAAASVSSARAGRCRRPGRARWSGRSTVAVRLSPSRAMSASLRWVACTTVVALPSRPMIERAAGSACSRRTPSRHRVLSRLLAEMEMQCSRGAKRSATSRQCRLRYRPTECTAAPIRIVGPSCRAWPPARPRPPRCRR